MCGLFGGYSSFLSKQEVERVEELGVLSQFRGRHSAGTIVSSKPYINKAKRVIRIRKCVGTTSHLFSDKSYRETVDNSEVQFIVGHARFATVGDITTANAHPFKCDHIYGVHNGTIHSFVVPKGQESENSDSRILFNKIKEVGVDRALEEAKDGAYAIVYYDLSNDTLNFARNDKRTLYYVEVMGTMYWASESRFLSFVFDRTSNYGSTVQVRPFLPGRLYSLKIGRHPSAMTTRELEVSNKEEKEVVVENTTRTFLPATIVKSITTTQENTDDGNVSSRGVDLSNSTSTTAIDNVVRFQPIKLKGGAVISKEDKKRMKNNVIFYRGYNNKIISLNDVTNLLSKGCVFTGVKSTIRDTVYWISPTEYVNKSFFETSSTELLLRTNENSGNPVVFPSLVFNRNQISTEKESVTCH